MNSSGNSAPEPRSSRREEAPSEFRRVRASLRRLLRFKGSTRECFSGKSHFAPERAVAAVEYLILISTAPARDFAPSSRKKSAARGDKVSGHQAKETWLRKRSDAIPSSARLVCAPDRNIPPFHSFGFPRTVGHHTALASSSPALSSLGRIVLRDRTTFSADVSQAACSQYKRERPVARALPR